MIKPDVILTWPTGCDFPVWRSMMRNNRDYFWDVFVVMSESYGKHDFTSFLQGCLMHDHVKMRLKDNYIQLADWRNSAVNAVIGDTTQEWVWFTEQDFFVKEMEMFMRQVSELAKDNDVIYVLEGDRIHPACLFVKKEWIEKTSKDFGVVAGKSDHFGKFVDELAAAGAKMAQVGKMGVEYYHMNGLTHNYRLIEDGKTKNIYQPGLFQLYNSYARMINVEQDPYFIDLSFKVDRLLSPIAKRFFRGV